MTSAPAWRHAALSVGIPALFVVLWSTGFIFAKLGLPSAEPATFLAVRFLFVIPVLLVLAVALRSRWPSPRGAAHSAVVGVLMHVVYLGGVFAAIEKGVPAGVSALIVGMQPLLTATLGRPHPRRAREADPMGGAAAGPRRPRARAAREARAGAGQRVRLRALLRGAGRHHDRHDLPEALLRADRSRRRRRAPVHGRARRHSRAGVLVRDRARRLDHGFRHRRDAGWRSCSRS